MRVRIPSALPVFDIESIFHDPDLDTLIELKLENDIEIYKALFEFSRAVYYYEKSKASIKKHNQKITKERKDTINHLKKTLEIDYPFLPNKTTEHLKKTLKRLNRYDEMEINYNPLSDLHFLSNLAEIRSLEKIYSFCIICTN